MLLRDNAGLRRWDVCAAWHAPGPDFVTTSGVVDVSVELNDVIDPCDFTINVRAVEKPSGDLELRYLSATEGKY